MNYRFLALLLPFAFASVPAIRAYALARKILRFVKEHDHAKWEYLMSSKWPILDGLINESFIWVNSRRFGQFIREEKDSTDPELQRLIRSYRRATIAFVICFVVWLVSLLITAAATIQFK